MHLTSQCIIKMVDGLLSNHKRFFIHRKVVCIDPKCSFWGPKNTLFRHIKSSGCVQVLTDSTWDVTKLGIPYTTRGTPVTYVFGHRVDDFPQNSPSIMTRRLTTTTWRPIVLGARGLLAACIHLITVRRPNGH